MRFNILTLFPEFFDSPLACSMLGKGADQGLVDFNLVNPRDFSTDKHRTVDDRPYGGGPGMVMMCDPLVQALESLERPGRIIYLSPRGRRFDQATARELAAEQEITMICGRYEGLDERVLELFGVEQVSIGDYVLNGGETGALAVTEAVARLVPEFMGHDESADEESFSQGLLEYPHYTRPETYRDLSVPKVLTSGDHKKIAVWRREQSLRTTLANRPDLLSEASLGVDDVRLLRAVRRQKGAARLGRNLYVALLHAPVLNKHAQTVAVSLTNLDIHDIARVSRTFGLGGYYIATPLTDQRKLLDALIAHWRQGPGTRANLDRTEAIGTIRSTTDLDEIVADVTERTGQAPRLVATTARGAGDTSPGDVRRSLDDGPVLLVMGTAHGLAPEILERASGVLRPVRPLVGYNHLSVRSATAIIIDRVLGDAY